LIFLRPRYLAIRRQQSSRHASRWYALKRAILGPRRRRGDGRNTPSLSSRRGGEEDGNSSAAVSTRRRISLVRSWSSGDGSASFGPSSRRGSKRPAPSSQRQESYPESDEGGLPVALPSVETNRIGTQEESSPVTIPDDEEDAESVHSSSSSSVEIVFESAQEESAHEPHTSTNHPQTASDHQREDALHPQDRNDDAAAEDHALGFWDLETSAVLDQGGEQRDEPPNGTEPDQHDSLWNANHTDPVLDEHLFVLET